ncbi:MAG: hypothetical protein ABJB12_22985 [Pseudomonadota bacterium]
MLLVWSGAVGCATATNGGPIGGNDFGDTDTGGSTTSQGGSSVAGSAPSGAPGAGASSGGAPAGGSGNAGSPSGGASSGGSAGSVGAAGAAGHAGGASGGSAGAGGGTATAGAGGGTSSGPCASPKDVKGGMSGNLGLGAVCMRTTETFNTLVCSNWTGRTIKVNGVLAMCSVKTMFPPMIAGYNYFEVSAGALSYASFNWFSS